MPLAHLHAPFDHADWIFEPKLDGFRALAYIDHGTARLVSRRQNIYKSFPALTAAVAAALPGHGAVLDGEIVHLGPDGVPMFLRSDAPPLSAARRSCGRDRRGAVPGRMRARLDGIVAKLAGGAYTPEETTWVKIKNPRYSQADGRADFFEGRALQRGFSPQIATFR